MSTLASLARTAVLRQKALPPLRSFHTTYPARSDHGHYNHLPFTFPVQNKKTFGVKVFVFLGSAFAIPFAAARWQLRKSQAT